MADFVAWIPPAGAVVAAPVHHMTVVDVIYSDKSEHNDFYAGDINWAADGDGPCVVAYAVVEEYKPAPGVGLTAITTPFGMLDAATQDALRAHGGPYEAYCMDGWRPIASPAFFRSDVYRVKPGEVQPAEREEYTPAPKVAREWWTVGLHMHNTEATAMEFRQACADDHGDHHLKTPIIHVREVLHGREVVAWAVVNRDGVAPFPTESGAQAYRRDLGGTVVRLSGVMP